MFGKKKTYPCPESDGSSPKTQKFDAEPSFCLKEGASYRAIMKTSAGGMEFKLFADKAPVTVNNFVFLARYHYYDGITFHRIIPGFVVQGGDPTGTGAGGPGYRFRDELPSQGSYRIGSLAMANAGPNTNGSQFFIISGPAGVELPPLYSLFGEMTSGEEALAVLDQAGSREGKPQVEHTIETVIIVEE
jgi:cyclophilin family peptidyl-prolyl cis-trans isomerase